MNYKYVVFDFDGTLADSFPIQNEILKQLANKHHFSGVNVEDFKARENMTLIKKAKIISLVIRIQSEFKALYGERLFKVKPYEGILSLLVSLHTAGYGIAIITSNAAENVAKFLQLNGFTLEIPIISSKRLFGKHKAIVEFIRQYHCHSSDVLYVGDEIRDVHACNKSDVDIAMVKWGLDANKDVKAYKIKFIASSVLELRQLLISTLNQ